MGSNRSRRLITAFAVLAVSAAACLVTGCGGKAPEPATPAAASATTGGTAATPSGAPATATAPSKDVKAIGEAKVGDTTRCPVSGEEFVVEATSPHQEY